MSKEGQTITKLESIELTEVQANILTTIGNNVEKLSEILAIQQNHMTAMFELISDFYGIKITGDCNIDNNILSWKVTK